MDAVDLDWQDVLGRARRGRRRRLAGLAAVAALAIGAGSAFAVSVTRPAYAKLPPQAVKAKSMVVVDPASGRILMQVAPWQGHRGVCYVVLRRVSACTKSLGRHATVSTDPPRVWMTFAVPSASPKYHVAFVLPPNTICRLRRLDPKDTTIAKLHVDCSR